jgi:hypothetical protein
MKLSSVALASLSALGIGLAGCATEPAETEAEATAAVIEGVIRIDRTASEEGLASSVSAKFLRAQPEDIAHAERLVGTQVELPAPGECTLIAVDSTPREPLRSDALTRGARRAVELVDVGDLSLRAASSDRTWQLNPRAFPDIGDLVSGVFYTQPDTGAGTDPDLPMPGSYVITGTGATAVDAFSFSVDAPSMPSNVRVGEDPAKGSIAVGRDIPVEWDADDARSIVYVDVHGAHAYRCTFHDTGAAIVPSDVLSREDSGQSVVVAVHRVRDEIVRVDLQDGGGQELANVRFDFARSSRVVVE